MRQVGNHKAACQSLEHDCNGYGDLNCQVMRCSDDLVGSATACSLGTQAIGEWHYPDWAATCSSGHSQRSIPATALIPEFGAQRTSRTPRRCSAHVLKQRYPGDQHDLEPHPAGTRCSAGCEMLSGRAMQAGGLAALHWPSLHIRISAAWVPRFGFGHAAVAGPTRPESSRCALSRAHP